MMSSVIPARLEFQCGHAALVSLPRVKGESSAQRNDRIAREKSAAQARSCDFCPPLTVADVAQAVIMVAAQPEPVVVVAAQPEPVAVVTAQPEPVVVVAAQPEPVVVVAAQPEAVAPPVELVLPAAPVAATTTPRHVARPRRNGAATRIGRAPVYQFVVRFRTEAVLEATDIRDALRQAERLGATDVLGLVAIG